jgi:hypothetical protein
MHVSFTAFSSSGSHMPVVVLNEIFNGSAGAFINEKSSQGNFDNAVFAVFACLIFFTAVFSVFRLVFSFIAKIKQSFYIRVGDKNNIASLAAISPVRTAVGHEGFTAERNATVSSFA